MFVVELSSIQIMPSYPFIADTNYCEYNDIGSTALDYEILLISINFINIYNVTDYFQPLNVIHLCYLSPHSIFP